jgi:hypothetical protein
MVELYITHDRGSFDPIQFLKIAKENIGARCLLC